jgi:hypothetical protein
VAKEKSNDNNNNPIIFFRFSQIFLIIFPGGEEKVSLVRSREM